MLRSPTHTFSPARLVYRQTEPMADATWRGEVDRDDGDALRRECVIAARCPNVSPECACLRRAMRALEASILRDTRHEHIDATTVVSYHYGEPLAAQTVFQPRVIDALFDDRVDAARVRQLAAMDLFDLAALPTDELRRYHTRLRLASCAATHLRVSRQAGEQCDAFLVNTVSAIDQHIGAGLELGEMLQPSADEAIAA